MEHLSIHYGSRKKNKSPIDLLFYKNQFCKKQYISVGPLGRKNTAEPV